MGYKVVVVGATGNVGREMLNILDEHELLQAIVRQDVQRCCRPSKRVGKKKHVEENTKPRPTGAQGEQMDESGYALDLGGGLRLASGLETEQNDINAEEEVDMMQDLEEGSEVMDQPC